MDSAPARIASEGRPGDSEAARDPSSFGERKRRCAAWLVVAIAAWQAGRGAYEVCVELGRRPFAQHVRVFEASAEELVQAKLGKDFEVWRALREQAPRDALVLVSFLNRRTEYHALRRRLTKLESLTYPITLKGWPYDPQRPGPTGAGTAPRKEYVLELDSGRDYSAWPLCTELARGRGFRLLLVGNQTAGSEAR